MFSVTYVIFWLGRPNLKVTVRKQTNPKQGTLFSFRYRASKKNANIKKAKKVGGNMPD